jgi:HD-like signal output (HDOD) protein
MNGAAAEADFGSELRERMKGTLRRLSRTGALPTLPAAASAALGIARDPDADIDKLARVIQTDVGLSARVLRAANSVTVGRRAPARRLNDAILTLGLRHTCELLVAACARQLYEASSTRAEALWEHALAVAVACEELARVTHLAEPGQVFLPGLFHDVGRVALLLADERSLEVIDWMVDAGEGQRLECEREWYGFDHAEAGAMLAEDWGLALGQCDAIRGHHDPNLAGAAQSLAKLLNGADWIAYKLGYGTSREVPGEITLAQVGLEEADAEKCIEQVREGLARQKEILG